MMQTAGKAKNQLTGRQKKKIRLVLLLLPFMIFVLMPRFWDGVTHL